MAETSAPASQPPVVGIPACSNPVGAHDGYTVVAKYIAAVAEGAGALPMVLPPLGAAYQDGAQPGGGWTGLVARLDGLLLTGSPSNVHPERYGGTMPAEGMRLDPPRDATNLPLIRAAVAAGVPLLAICRGFQELNVAYGGTLHPRVDQLPACLPHTEDPNDPLAVQYAPRHDVSLTRDGVLAELAGGAATWRVNSVHTQAIAALAPALTVEAMASDGIVEAARLTDAPAFTLGVQWHPEWRFTADSLATALFATFGAAAARRAATRPEPAPMSPA